MQCQRTFTKRFTHSTQKEIAPFYGNSHKICISLAAVAKYIAISCKIDYLQIFQAGYFLQRSKLPWSFNETTIMSLYYLA